MTNPAQTSDEEKGDEILRRMLSTLPKPNKDKPKAADKKENGVAAKPPR